MTSPVETPANPTKHAATEPVLGIDSVVA
jgi:hypothetical protein